MSANDVELAVSVVNAHLTMNRMSSKDVPSFIRQVHGTLQDLRGSGASAPHAEDTTALPPPAERPAAQSQVVAPELPIEPAPPGPGAGADADSAIDPAIAQNKVAQIRQEDISDPVFQGLDPWLARRISHKTASKLDPNNEIHPSVFPDHLVCLEDGNDKVKLLRPYIFNRFGLTIAEYVDKWNLPDDYPTAPPNYIASKRAAAQASGLGVTTRAHREKKKPTRAAASAGATGAKAAAGGRGRRAPAATAPAPAPAPTRRSGSAKASGPAKTSGAAKGAASGRAPGTRRRLTLFNRDNQPA